MVINQCDVDAVVAAGKVVEGLMTVFTEEKVQDDKFIKNAITNMTASAIRWFRKRDEVRLGE